MLAFVLLLATWPGAIAIFTAGVRLVRTLDQKHHDRQRDGFIVTLPRDIKPERLQAWVKLIQSTYKPGPRRFVGIPTCVFEITATAASTTHRIELPHKHADALVAQLRAHIPGILVKPDSGAVKEPWRHVRELAHSNPGRTLSISDGEILSTSILNSFHPLHRSEAVSIQIILSPAVPEEPPEPGGSYQSHEFGFGSMVRRVLVSAEADKDEVADRRAKLSEPNVLVLIRIASRAETDAQAKHLVERVMTAFSSTDNHATHLRERYPFMQWHPKTREMLHRRFLATNAPLTFPSQFRVTEMAALMGWPIGEAHAPGLPQGHSRQLPATEDVARVGRVIGVSNFQGQTRPLAVTAKNRNRHVQVVGQSGSGKTTLLHNLIVQDIAAGDGVVVVDPKSDPEGNLVQRVLNSIPPSRIDDVILIDVNDTMFPVGVNFLQGDPAIVISDLQSVFFHLYPEDARMVNVRKSLFHVLMTLMLAADVLGPQTFVDIEALCVPDEDERGYSRAAIDAVSHYERLERFWRERKNEGIPRTAQYFSPLLNRTWQITSRPQLFNMVGQAKSGFDMYEALRTQKIMLVDISGQDTDTVKLFGSLFINSLWSAVKKGATSPGNPTFIYLDEFQNFLNLPISPQDILQQGRSMGAYLTLAHQSLTQLDSSRELKSAIKANVATKIFLGQSVEDAREFARDFGPTVSEDDLLNQHAHEFIGKFATDNGVSWPISGVTYPSPGQTNSAYEARKRSRAKYARPVGEVEAEIKARHMIKSTRLKAVPSLGGIPWEVGE
jgi:hypothetical protein